MPRSSYRLVALLPVVSNYQRDRLSSTFEVGVFLNDFSPASAYSQFSKEAKVKLTIPPILSFTSRVIRTEISLFTGNLEANEVV